MSRLLLALGVVLAAALVPPAAVAYPQHVAKGYTNCGTCHYSPTGGGLPNAYGFGATQATFPDTMPSGALTRLRKTLGKNLVTGFSEDGTPALHWDIGFDARVLLMPVPRAVGGTSQLTPIPMLAELSGVLARGPLLAYATLSPRRATAARRPNTVFSREHWLQLKLGDGKGLRVGRMVLPFGLRMPDHTQYVREDLGFDKYGQAHALAFEWESSRFFLAAAASAGDLMLEPGALQERGGAVTGQLNLSGRGAVGLSLLGGLRRESSRGAVSLFTRLKLVGSSYVMAEAVAERTWSELAPGSRNLFAGFARLGWYLLESLDVYLEWGGRTDPRAWELTRARYAVGAQWQVLPWVEIAPTLLFEETVETGMGVTGHLQVHLVY